MEQVAFSLGSNLGNRHRNLLFASEQLINSLSITNPKTSSIYETSPVDYLAQPTFYNCVVVGLTAKSPSECIGACSQIPKATNSQKEFRFGPRIIDLDLVLYGELSVQSKDFCVPHPRFRSRLFVLVPLAEVAPNLLDPTTKKSVFELAKEATQRYAQEQRITKVFGALDHRNAV